MRKYCIINGDDFGASQGINLGVLKAHQKGVLTSTSLMVDMPASGEAAQISRKESRLSIGLHIVLTSEECEPLIDFDSINSCRKEIIRQWERFVSLVGRVPTHLDAHHNICRDTRLKPIFLEWSKKMNVPLRENSVVRYFSEFYGQWDGETHLEQISVENLCRMIETKINGQFTELSCHPGYVDPDFVTPYDVERETELRTICDPKVRRRFDQLGIQLINYRDLNEMIPDMKVGT